MLFTPGTGNQGGEGTDHGQEWYIENVLQELDDPKEWYYDYKQGLLSVVVSSLFAHSSVDHIEFYSVLLH